MVKQKIVIKLSIKNAHKRTKAFKAVAGIHNITSTSIVDGDKVVVEGESIDPIALITVLRKKLGYAELVSVTPVEEKKKDKNATPVYYCAAPAPGYPCHYAYEVNQYPDHSCSIL